MGTPSLPDLGQNRCLACLEEALARPHTKNSAIIYATSQGTATALNFLGHTNSPERINGLVLEATLASGNSAIIHTLQGPLMNQEWATNLPLSYYLIPYLAKAMFPTYWPAGKQPIKSIDKNPTNIPVIIIHSKKDPQLSFNDACALYYGLRKNNNKNVYFISCEGSNHLSILANERHKKKAVAEILAHHDLLESKENLDLSVYQPDPNQFKKQYDELSAKEKKHELLKYTLVLGACVAAYKKFKSVPTYLVNIALKRYSQNAPPHLK